MSLFGEWHFGKAGERPAFATVERTWNDNLPNVSCFPDGFYRLVRHNGTKYQNTWAFVGATVGFIDDGLRRHTCVIHWSPMGSRLKGCVSIGDYANYKPGSSELIDAVGHEDAMERFMRRLDSARETHYVTVQTAFRRNRVD